MTLNKIKWLMLVVAAIMVCSLSSTTVYGQTKNTWVGVGPDLRWNNPANWSLGHAPLNETAEFAQFDQSSENAGYPCIIDDTHVGENAAMCQRTNFGFVDGHVGKRSWQSQDLVDWCYLALDEPMRFNFTRQPSGEDELADFRWALTGYAYKSLTGGPEHVLMV